VGAHEQALPAQVGAESGTVGIEPFVVGEEWGEAGGFAALVESFANFNDVDSQTVINKLAKKSCRETFDIRSWNYSRWKASRLLNTNTSLFDPAGRCAAEPVANPDVDEF